MQATQWTFELLRGMVHELPDAAQRRPIWVRDRTLAIALVPFSGLELWIAGEPIVPRQPALQRQLHHGTWIDPDGKSFRGSRLVVPAEPSFVPMIAMIALELVRAGLGSSLVTTQAAWELVEPILETVAQRALQAEASTLELFGELMALDVMLEAIDATPQHRSTVVSFWRGHAQNDRDFVIGSRAIEVKTTPTLESSHHVGELAQLERRSEERSLHLLSIGLTPSRSEGQTLGFLVERILARLADANEDGEGALNVSQQRFLGALELHQRERFVTGQANQERWALFQPTFALRFIPRIYDLSDPALRVLRRGDLEGTFVNPHDVRYRVDLPAKLASTSVTSHSYWRQALNHFVRERVMDATTRDDARVLLLTTLG